MRHLNRRNFLVRAAACGVAGPAGVRMIAGAANAAPPLETSGGEFPGAPASVTRPVRGTPLTQVWNLQAPGATGPRSSLLQTYANDLVALKNRHGFFFAEGTRLTLVVRPGQTITLERVDFTGAPQIEVYGAGTLVFNDCKFTAGINLGKGPDHRVTTHVQCNHCEFDGADADAVIFINSGTVTSFRGHHHNLNNWLGSFEYNGAGAVYGMTFQQCYIHHVGMNPGPGTHVELWQQAALGPLVVDQCMHDFSAHASVPDWGGGWTGVYSMNAFTPGGVISNSIFWGIEEVNAARPGRITCIVAYGGLSPTTANNLTLTNNVLEAGAFGYTKDQNGSTHRPGDGGGNRSRRNLAITAADFS